MCAGGLERARRACCTAASCWPSGVCADCCTGDDAEDFGRAAGIGDGLGATAAWDGAAAAACAACSAVLSFLLRWENQICSSTMASFYERAWMNVLSSHPYQIILREFHRTRTCIWCAVRPILSPRALRTSSEGSGLTARASTSTVMTKWCPSAIGAAAQGLQVCLWDDVISDRVGLLTAIGCF